MYLLHCLCTLRVLQSFRLSESQQQQQCVVLYIASRSGLCEVLGKVKGCHVQLAECQQDAASKALSQAPKAAVLCVTGVHLMVSVVLQQTRVVE
jgi:hypothetical protein